MDTAPGDQQNTANAWAGRMIGIGNVVGFLMGFSKLTSIFPFLGNTQLKVLCILSLFLLCITVFCTCIFIKELPYEGLRIRRMWWEPLSEIMQSVNSLPEFVRKICHIQFFSWIGWFPLLFYRFFFSSPRKLTKVQLGFLPKFLNPIQQTRRSMKKALVLAL